MIKILNLLCVFVVLISCNEEPIEWATEETEYFFFDKPVDLKYTYSEDKELGYNIQQSIEAIGNDSTFQLRKSGVLKFKQFKIEFFLNSENEFGYVPSSCSDFSDKELFLYGENHNTGVHTIRFITKEKNNYGNYFLNACFDGEHLFHVRQVKEKDLELLKRILLKVPVKA
jgi:hypothetical protein